MQRETLLHIPDLSIYPCIHLFTSIQLCTFLSIYPSSPVTPLVYIQGFGNVGAWAAEILTEFGGKVIAVSDVNAAMINEAGLDIKALRQHLATGNYHSFVKGDIGKEGREGGRGDSGMFGAGRLAGFLSWWCAAACAAA